MELVEAPGTAPGSEKPIPQAVYRHSRVLRRQSSVARSGGAVEDRICGAPSTDRCAGRVDRHRATSRPCLGPWADRGRNRQPSYWQLGSSNCCRRLFPKWKRGGSAGWLRRGGGALSRICAAMARICPATPAVTWTVTRVRPLVWHFCAQGRQGAEFDEAEGKWARDLVNWAQYQRWMRITGTAIKSLQAWLDELPRSRPKPCKPRRSCHPLRCCQCRDPGPDVRCPTRQRRLPLDTHRRQQPAQPVSSNRGLP